MYRGVTQPMLRFASPEALLAAPPAAATAAEKTLPVLFMGSDDFSLAGLEALLSAGYHVAAVATQPDRPVGRKQRLTPTVVKVKAQAVGIPVYTWTGLRSPEALRDLQSLDPALIVTSSYGNLLPPAFLDYPRYACINLHPSALPRWRGASPIQAAILAGDESTAVTIYRMGEGLDDGDLLASCEVPIDPFVTAPELETYLARLSGTLLLQMLPAWLRGEITGVKQTAAAASYAGKLSRESGRLDFTDSARRNADKVRGLLPWPTAFAYYGEKRYKILEAVALPGGSQRPAGTVFHRDRALLVACGEGALCLKVLQGPNGKKVRGADCYHNYAEGSKFTGYPQADL